MIRLGGMEHVDPTFTGYFCGDPMCSCEERAYQRGIISRRTYMERMPFIVKGELTFSKERRHGYFIDLDEVERGIAEIERYANES